MGVAYKKNVYKQGKTRRHFVYIFKALGYVRGLWVSEVHIKL